MDIVNGTNSSECASYVSHHFTSLQHFASTYRNIHIYLGLIICPIGAFTNALNVVILNQKGMRSPTNFLLTALAITDGLIMAFYIPFDAYFLLGNHLLQSPYPWTVYMMLYISLQNVLHGLSSGIIVALAAFRVLYVRCLTKCKVLCSIQRARITVAIVFLVSVVLTIPYSFAHHITLINNQTNIYMVNYVDNKVLLTLLFWNTAIFIKLLPLVLVTILSLILIMTIRQRDRMMKTLKARVNHSKSKQEDESRQDKTGTRTTKLLLSIILIFMIAYLPQAILLLLSGILGFCFTENVYDQVGDFMDLLTLLNNGINFVIYCSMSKQFRDTFVKVFCPKSCSTASPSHQGDLRRSVIRSHIRKSTHAVNEEPEESI